MRGAGRQEGQTLESSFFAVSTPPVARIGAFFSDFSISTRFTHLYAAAKSKFPEFLEILAQFQ